jgi:hypothetical protein
MAFEEDQSDCSHSFWSDIALLLHVRNDRIVSGVSGLPKPVAARDPIPPHKAGIPGCLVYPDRATADAGKCGIGLGRDAIGDNSFDFRQRASLCKCYRRINEIFTVSFQQDLNL